MAQFETALPTFYAEYASLVGPIEKVVTGEEVGLRGEEFLDWLRRSNYRQTPVEQAITRPKPIGRPYIPTKQQWPIPFGVSR